MNWFAVKLEAIRTDEGPPPSLLPVHEPDSIHFIAFGKGSVLEPWVTSIINWMQSEPACLVVTVEKAELIEGLPKEGELLSLTEALPNLPEAMLKSEVAPASVGGLKRYNMGDEA